MILVKPSTDMGMDGLAGKQGPAWGYCGRTCICRLKSNTGKGKGLDRFSLRCVKACFVVSFQEQASFK